MAKITSKEGGKTNIGIILSLSLDPFNASCAENTIFHPLPGLHCRNLPFQRGFITAFLGKQIFLNVPAGDQNLLPFSCD